MIATTTQRMDNLTRWFATRPLLAAAALLLTAWVTLLWPAILNGQPFMLHDTTAYFRGAAYPAERLLDLKTAWSQTQPTAVPSQVIAGVHAKPASSVEDKTVYAGRSVYYGSLLFWAYVVGGLWLPVMLQAAIVALALFMAFQVFVPRPALTTAGTLVGLGALTPLPWFTDYLVPDVFAGLGLLAAAMLLTVLDKMTTATRAFWFALLSFALAAHNSHVATIACVLAVTAFGTFVLRRSFKPAGYAWAAAAIGVALLGEVAFNLAVTKVAGAPPVRPPILTARVMASETGAAYLRAVCPVATYAVCPYADRAPMVGNDFLWNPDAAIGVFTVAEPATRRALGEEQMRVFFGAFAHAPIAMTREMLTRWWLLASSVRLDEFNHGPAERTYFAAKLPNDMYDTLLASPSGQGMLPVGALRLIFLPVTVGCAIALVLLAPRDENAAMREFALIVVVGVLINAAVCSALSGVEPRYQARIVWLIPFAAYVLALRRRDVWAWLGPRHERAAKPLTA